MSPRTQNHAIAPKVNSELNEIAAALKRTAYKAVHGAREERSGRFLRAESNQSEEDRTEGRASAVRLAKSSLRRAAQRPSKDDAEVPGPRPSRVAGFTIGPRDFARAR